MAINLVNGKMLDSNLLRGGVNLSVETDLIYLDVTSGRVGIKNAAPTTDFDVTGDLKATTAQVGNVSLAVNTINAVSGDLILSSTAGNISANSKRIIGCADPVGVLDVVNLQTLTTTVGAVQTDRIIAGDSSLIVVDTGVGSTFDFTLDSASVGSLSDTVLTVPGVSTAGTVAAGVVTGTTATLGNTTFSGTNINSNSTGINISATQVDLGTSVHISGTGLNRILFNDGSGNIATAAAISYTVGTGTLGVTGILNVDDLTLDAASITANTAGMSLTTTANGDLTVTVGSGLIDLQSSSALQLPSGTTAERPGVVVAGMTRWNETTGEVEYNDGAVWNGLQTAFLPTAEQFTPTPLQTIFTLNKAATTDTILVIINGIVQDPQGGAVYSVSGTTLTFTSGLAVTDIVSVRYLAK